MAQTGMCRDNSIVSLSGASQVGLPLNGNRQFLLIQNTGANPVGVNFSGAGAGGGTAVIGGAGTITLAPNEKFPQAGMGWIPQNAINLIGTSGQPVTIIEG